MNYPESSQILEEVKGAKRILINCHRSPDPDSVGSALAMRKVLMSLGKNVDIVCLDNISPDSKFLTSSDTIQRIDYDSFDFAPYDLFLLLDSSEWAQVAGLSNKIPDIKKIVIDHHYTNKGFGAINIVDSEISSTAEVLYKIFADWNMKISTEIAEDLLAGIIYDTSSLQHSSADVVTAKTMAHLMELGVDKDKIIFNFYRNISFDKVKLIGEILKNLQIDKDNRFVWSAIPHHIYLQYPDSNGVKSMAANFYASSIENTDFGMIMIEEKENFLSISMRAKVGSDISKIAEELGGGGHKQAGGVLIRDMPFSDAVEKVLAAARKYARKN